MNDEEIIDLIKKYRPMPNILCHCIVVSALSEYIAKAILKANPQVGINLQNLKTAGLLHDLLKIVDITPFSPQILSQNYPDETITIWQKLREKHKSQSHSAACEQILLQLNQKEIAEIIGKHDYQRILEPNFEKEKNETKILNYADKRVAHEKIVSLDERFQEANIRYSKAKKLTTENKLALKKFIKLEKEISKIAKLDLRQITNQTISHEYEETKKKFFHNDF